MKKIRISNQDYTYHGLGYNSFNFCKNVSPKVSTWLLSEFNSLIEKSFEETNQLAEKLKKIVDIINEEEDSE